MMKSWHAFAALLAVAVVTYALGIPTRFVPWLVAFIVVWTWACRRWPTLGWLTAVCALGFVSGLFGGGRYRRRW